ncbi:MAG: NAD(P)/FAD-dependent oxidoreductase [Alkalispirochaeta sp.]
MPANSPANRRVRPDTGGLIADVIVVGAGPIGLTVALGLGRAGLSVVVLEQRPEMRETSRAIGITPASLEILHRYGVANDLIAAGLPVRRAVIHGDRRVLTAPGFQVVGSPFPFILALPQQRTEEVLAKHVRRYPTVKVLRGATVTRVEPAAGHVTAYCNGNTGVVGKPPAMEARAADTGGVSEAALRARYLCGCDGKHSTVRTFVSDTWNGRRLRETFVMADITDNTDLGEVAHLYFTREGSVESFPLPGGIRRWIVETDRWLPEAPARMVQDLVARRTGVPLADAREHWRSSFQTERFRAKRRHRGRAFLAGDAAHVMPPIGGQGMNVGLGDAEHLSDLLILAHRDPARFAPGALLYEARRKRAFDVAARRSILGMKIGAARGRVRSVLRSLFLRGVLRGAPADWVMEHFAMIASPFRRSPWYREVDAPLR